MTIEQIKSLLKDARKNMMDPSMRDYAGEQIDIAIIELNGAVDEFGYSGYDVGYAEGLKENQS